MHNAHLAVNSLRVHISMQIPYPYLPKTVDGKHLQVRDTEG